MAKLTYDYLNQVSMVLGIICIILGVYGDFSSESKVLIVYLMPLLLYANYLALSWLSEKEKI